MKLWRLLVAEKEPEPTPNLSDLIELLEVQDKIIKTLLTNQFHLDRRVGAIEEVFARETDEAVRAALKDFMLARLYMEQAKGKQH